MISHKTCLEMAGITMLVYDYVKKFKLNQNETIESFVTNIIDEDMCKFSECRQEVLKNMKEYAPYGCVEFFINDNNSDLQVGVTTSEVNKRIVVVFRGSESRTDWMYDLMITKIRLRDNVYVHQGFHRQLHENNNYESLVEKVKELIEKYPDYEIYITGHSLGAALATLFGYELSHEIENNIKVISFASPRVGNQYFKTSYEAKENLTHYRITNDRDVVTAFPMYRYKHIGTNICLHQDNYEVYEKYEYTMFKYSLFNCWRVSDHNIELYYNRLKSNLWKEDV